MKFYAKVETGPDTSEEVFIGTISALDPQAGMKQAQMLAQVVKVGIFTPDQKYFYPPHRVLCVEARDVTN